MTAPDGRRWLRIPLSHARYATERPFRRAFHRDVRKAVQHLPGIYLDIWLQCREGGACCRREPVEATAEKLYANLQDWAGLEPIGSMRHEDLEALREGGVTVFSSDGGELP